MAMPDFPAMKSWTALGMSDVPGMAEPLAAKFSYTNTFYHQPPVFDVMVRDPSLDGRFDFIVSSEVLEHVPHPVGSAFDTLFHMLKPNGVLFLTVPYTIDEDAAEHFPNMHDFAVVALKERWVLVNRTADGRIETFDDLVFHGGPGSTLEMRVFDEDALRGLLYGAGFKSLRIAGESYPEFGIRPEGPWSLPIAARKCERVPDSSGFRELAQDYAGQKVDLRSTQVDLDRRNADYKRYCAWAEAKIGSLEGSLWGRIGRRLKLI